jgi:carbon storage regulator CsrA
MRPVKDKSPKHWKKAALLMLVLSRKTHQEIVLSNGTTFKVLGIERGRVQVGIAAAPGVHILRGECLRHEPGQLKRMTH